MNESFVVRQAEVADLPAVAALETEVWGIGAASEEVLARRFANCPEGNVVALTTDGSICGYTAFCYLDYSQYDAAGTCTWYDLSGDGTASTNVPGAPDLFGINLGCAPRAPKGVSQALLVEVVKAGVRRGVRRGILGARIPGYHRHADRLTPEEYVASERKPGVALDPELRYYYAFGMQPIRLVEDYFEDAPSLNWGVLVEMRVPLLLRISGPLVTRLPLDWNLLIDRYF